MPGIVRAYDARTKRARVQPAIRALESDANGGYLAVDRSVLLDVPVEWPGGGGFVLMMPLNDGDVVRLTFSERGLDNFKQAWDLSDPPALVQFRMADAVAFPIGAKEVTAVMGQDGGSLSRITPTASGNATQLTGATLQAVDGDPFIRISETEIRLKIGNTELYLTDGGMRLTTSAGTQNWGSP